MARFSAFLQISCLVDKGRRVTKIVKRIKIEGVCGVSSEGETVSRGIHSRVFGTNSAFSVGLRTAGEGGGCFG